MANVSDNRATGNRRRRLGIIYNSDSGRHRRAWTRHALPESVSAVEANDFAQIGRAVAQLAAEGVDLLAIAGGDGTVHSALTHVILGAHFETPPVIALVPTGSTNMTSYDVGRVNVSRRGWQPLRDWANNPASPVGQLVERAVMRIKPNDHEPAFCGMFFGAGAVYQAVQYTQHQLHSVGLRGDVGPGLTFMRFVKAIATRDRRYFSPTHFALRDADGRELTQHSMLLLASTLDRLVLRFHPFWGTEDGPLAWTAVSDDAKRFFRRLPAIARGRHRKSMTPDNGYASHNTTRLELSFDGGYIVDGEFRQARKKDGPVELSIAGKIRFLRL